MRVHQWVKNGAIFMPLFFHGKIFDPTLFVNSAWAFLGFSLIASSIYVFNDLRDVEEDINHPEKKFRPIAAGIITQNYAKYLILVLLTLSGLIFYGMFNSIWVWLCVWLYLVQNILYTVWLKKIALVDVIIISLGFVIRIFLGSAATDIYLSHWIIIMTFLLALFLAFAKRRDDLLLTTTTGVKHRSNIDGYNLEFLNAAIIISSAIVIVAYIMYTTSNEVILRTGKNIYLTSFFVIIGVFRYLQVVFVKQQSGNPTKVFLKDSFLQLIMIGWIISFGIILYFH
ncbi:MAG: UbiA prenyltransferase family protein [Bacteroidota bacterium]